MYVLIIIAVICLIAAVLCFIKDRSKAALLSLLGVILSFIGILVSAVDTDAPPPPSPTPTPISTPTAIPTPTAVIPTYSLPDPTDESTTHEVEMVGCDDRVVYPDDLSWLPEIESKYVRSKRGNCIILRWEPNEDYEYKGYNYLMKVNEGTLVTVLARQDGFSLIKVQDGVVGWVPSRLLGDS